MPIRKCRFWPDQRASVLRQSADGGGFAGRCALRWARLRNGHALGHWPGRHGRDRLAA